MKSKVSYNLTDEVLSLLDAFDGMIDVSIQIHDNFQPIYVSDGMLRQLGFSNKEEYFEMDSLLDLLPDADKKTAIGRYNDLMENGYTEPLEIENQNSNGDKYWVRVQDKRIMMNGKYIAMTLLSNITDQKIRESSLDMMAHRDELTGLANRRDFQRRTESVLQVYNSDSAFYIIDLDEFKTINDSYGHDTGDRILQSFAAVCRKCIRKTDLLARFGGDEFTLFSPSIGSENAEKLAEKIRSQVEEDVLLAGNQRVRYSVSIGISVATDREWVTFDKLFKDADSALYQSKEKGRNCATLFK